MAFNIVDGDVFDSKEYWICHQCNCVTTRSAHMAKSVFDKFPEADIYAARVGREDPKDKPGQAIIVDCGTKGIVNLLGQYYPGTVVYPTGKVDGYEARIKYFRKALFDMSKKLGGHSFAFPYGIGCGAAGGDWEIYVEILKRFHDYLNKTYGRGNVTIYKLPKKTRRRRK